MPEHAAVDTSIFNEFHRPCSKHYIQNLTCTKGKKASLVPLCQSQVYIFCAAGNPCATIKMDSNDRSLSPVKYIIKWPQRYMYTKKKKKKE